MVIGSLALMVKSLSVVGGYEALMEKYQAAEPDPEFSAFDVENKSCSAVQEDFLHMLRPVDVGAGDLPWSGLITGMTLSSIWYWCADQVLVMLLFTTNTIMAKTTITIMAKIIIKFIFTTTKKIISGDRATHPLRQDDHPRQGRLCTGRLPQGLIFNSTKLFLIITTTSTSSSSLSSSSSSLAWPPGCSTGARSLNHTSR